jgi:signal transduction histidine kinase
MNMPWLSEDEKEVAVEFCVRVTDRAYQLAEVAGERFRLISATHAMRQPVAALRADAYSLMDLLSATNFDEGEAVELARAIDAGAGRAMTSLQGYIHALQDQTGKAPHYAFRDSVKLGDLLLTVKNQYENAAAARHMEITLSSPVWGLPDIRADQQALKTSFGQLVDNAVKYGFAGTIDDPREIIVNGHHNNQDGTVIISVDDYGLTIDEEDLTRIFDYYEIGSHRDKRRTVPTSGIGLGVANSIVRAHGGRTWAVVNSRSTRPSDAAPDWTQAGRVVFHVELPIAGPAEETP